MRISIITINLNNRTGLDKTAVSIVSQTCRDYEWIVIDGGSGDGSVDVIRKYAGNIAYWVSEKDGGIYNAMNKGVDAATGDYLIFMNSGDCLHDPAVLSDFINIQGKGDIIYGNTERVDADDHHMGDTIPTGHLSLQYLFFKRLNHQSMFFSRKCFESDRYDESFKLLGDMDLMVRLAMRGATFTYWNHFVAKYDVTGVSARVDSKNEIERAIENNVPKFILLDYKESSYNDSDIAVMSRDIIESNVFIRSLTRSFLYPIHWIYKLLKKSYNETQ